MKRLIPLFLVLFLTACGNKAPQTEVEKCPICGQTLDYEIIEAEDVAKWLAKQDDYIVIDVGFDYSEMQKAAYEYYMDDPAFIEEDFLFDDIVLDYLESEGWTIIPPEEKK